MDVMTVTGPVGRDELGFVLPHEHVFIDLVREYRGSGLLNDEHLACQELGALKAAGGGTLVDLTPDEIGRDITEGVRGTGVRAGIIGEIGADRRYISAAEERSFRAAARAHLKTGLTISTHAARWPVGLAQLKLLA